MSVRLPLLAVLAALALPVSAPAATSAPAPGIYGGGAFREFVQFASVTVAPDRATASLRARLVYRCKGFAGPLTDGVDVRPTRLTAGSLSGTTGFTERVREGVPHVGGLTRTGTIEASLRVRAGGRANGVARIQSTYRPPGGGAAVASCDTGRVAFAVRRPRRSAGRGQPRPRRGRAYLGTTRQGGAFLMRLSRRGRTVTRAAMTAMLPCTRAATDPIDIVARTMPVSRRGRFGTRGTSGRDYVNELGVPVRERYRWRLRGRFGSRGAVGSWSITGEVLDRRTGVRLGSACSLRRNTWRAVL